MVICFLFLKSVSISVKTGRVQATVGVPHLGSTLVYGNKHKWFVDIKIKIEIW